MGPGFNFPATADQNADTEEKNKAHPHGRTGFLPPAGTLPVLPWGITQNTCSNARVQTVFLRTIFGGRKT